MRTYPNKVPPPLDVLALCRDQTLRHTKGLWTYILQLFCVQSYPFATQAESANLDAWIEGLMSAQSTFPTLGLEASIVRAYQRKDWDSLQSLAETMGRHSSDVQFWAERFLSDARQHRASEK